MSEQSIRSKLRKICEDLDEREGRAGSPGMRGAFFTVLIGTGLAVGACGDSVESKGGAAGADGTGGWGATSSAYGGPGGWGATSSAYGGPMGGWTGTGGDGGDGGEAGLGGQGGEGGDGGAVGGSGGAGGS